MFKISQRAASKVIRSPPFVLRLVCKMHCDKCRELSLSSSTQRRLLAAPSLKKSIPSSMISMFCDARIAIRVAVAVRTVFKTCRLIFSPTKCKFLVRPDTVLPGEGLNQFGVERNGIVIMGNPIGTEYYRWEKVFKITRAAMSVIPALMKLLPWVALSLLCHCVSTRVGYIARVSERDRDQHR